MDHRLNLRCTCGGHWRPTISFHANVFIFSGPNSAAREWHFRKALALKKSGWRWLWRRVDKPPSSPMARAPAMTQCGVMDADVGLQQWSQIGVCKLAKPNRQWCRHTGSSAEYFVYYMYEHTAQATDLLQARTSLTLSPWPLDWRGTV